MKATFRDVLDDNFKTKIFNTKMYDLPTFNSIKWVIKDDKKHQYFFSNSKLLCLIKREGKKPYLDIIHVVYDNTVERRGIHFQVSVTGLIGGSGFFDFSDWDKVIKFAVIYGKAPCTVEQAEKE